MGSAQLLIQLANSQWVNFLSFRHRSGYMCHSQVQFSLCHARIVDISGHTIFQHFKKDQLFCQSVLMDQAYNVAKTLTSMTRDCTFSGGSALVLGESQLLCAGAILLQWLDKLVDQTHQAQAGPGPTEHVLSNIMVGEGDPLAKFARRKMNSKDLRPQSGRRKGLMKDHRANP